MNPAYMFLFPVLQLRNRFRLIHNMYRRQADEWGEVVQRQTELNKQMDVEREERERLQKEAYKQDLQYQQYLRDQARETERRQREVEAQEVQSAARLFQNESDRRKQEQVMLKRSLADSYNRHSELMKEQERADRARALREEQLHLEQVRVQLEAEGRRKKEAKEAIAHQEQSLLQFRSLQEEQRRQTLQQEKVYEQKLNQDYIQREEQKEKAYQDYFHRVNQDQMQKVLTHHQTVTTAQREKDMQRMQWVLDNEQQHRQRLSLKEDLERQTRLANVSSTNQTLRMQLEEKERRKQEEHESFLRQQQDVKQKAALAKQAEDARAIERKQQQQEYRSILQTQTAISQETRSGGNRMTDYERSLNKHILENRSVLQAGAAQILKPVYSSHRTASQPDLAWDKNAKAFYGDEEKSRLDPLQQRKQHLQSRIPPYAVAQE